MKIGIDISQIVYQTGVSRYTEKLVDNLLRIDKKNEYIFLGYSLRQREKIQNLKCKIKNCNAKFKIFPIPPTPLEFLWNKLHLLEVERLIGRVDIFHSSDWIQPPTRAKKVTTVHDLSFLHFPETFPKKIIKTQKRRLYWVKEESDLVIADSKATKDDLVSLLGFSEERIRIVYLGKTQSAKLKAQSHSAKLKAIKKKYNISNNYLLYLGTLQPRKNLIRLVKAFANVKNQKPKTKNTNSKTKKLEDLKLVMAGKKGWLYKEIFNKVKELGLEKEVIFTGFVSEKEKQALLKNALCFVYPSLYEGFGIPVLEAMAAGCPVVTSKTSSLPEVAGEAAVLVNPQKVDEIGLAIKKVLGSKRLQSNLRKKGLQQVKKFSWEKCARETLKVYEEVGS